MTTHHIGRIVAGCLAAGLVVALALVIGPVAGAQEHVITGTVLLTFASSWALLAALSMRWTTQPQRWALVAGGFMGAGRRGSSRLHARRRGHRRAWLGLAAALACASGGHGRSRSAGVSAVARVPGSCTRCSAFTRSGAIGGGYQTVRESLDRRDLCGTRPTDRCRRTPAALELRRVRYAHRHPRIRPRRDCCLVGDGSPPRSRTTRECASTTGRVEVGAIRRRSRNDGVARSHGPARPARARARAWSLCACWPFSGAQYVRIFAGRYPEQVAGMVLLDGQPAEAFESLPAFPDVLHLVSPRLCAAAVAGATRRRPALSITRLRQPAGTRTLDAASQLLVCASVSQPARRVRGATDVARAGAFVPEPRRPAAGRRHGCCGRAGGMAAACRTRWRRCRRTAATASCRSRTTDSSGARWAPRSRVRPSVTLSGPCGPAGP